MAYRHLTIFTLLALCVALPPVALASTTWYVNGANGNDSNNCQTAETACKTIGHAISLASSGDSILIAAGLYQEHLTIAVNLNLIGSSQNTIIDGLGTDRVVNISVATATVTLSNLIVRNGRASSGAGILNYGTLTVNNTTISGNSSQFWGGGIYNSGTLKVINSTLSGNSASNSCNYTACLAAGGAIYNYQGGVTISNSTLNGNRAYNLHRSLGGGIFNGGGTLIVNNSTVAENSVQALQTYCSSNSCVAYGGGIWSGGDTTISNSTLSGNGALARTAALGGGIYISGTTAVFQAVFQNSIVADNPSGGNCNGAVTSKGYNLSSDGTCNFNSRGDLNNHDPLLGPLQNNGGPTDTMALLSGSPAIDAGNPSGCTDAQGNLLKTDQRGMPRPDPEDTGGCDMGAYESQSD